MTARAFFSPALYLLLFIPLSPFLFPFSVALAPVTAPDSLVKSSRVNDLIKETRVENLSNDALFFFAEAIWGYSAGCSVPGVLKVWPISITFLKIGKVGLPAGQKPLNK